MSRRGESQWLVFSSLLAGVVLMLLPLPEWAQPARPYWVALVLIYWSVEGTYALSLRGAFLVGLALDIVFASLLGQHALSLLVIVFLAERFRLRLRYYPIVQQTLAVLALLINDRFLMLWVILLEGTRDLSWTFWISPLAGAVAWPWLFLLLDRMRRIARARA